MPTVEGDGWCIQARKMWKWDGLIVTRVNLSDGRVLTPLGQTHGLRPTPSSACRRRLNSGVTREKAGPGRPAETRGSTPQTSEASPSESSSEKDLHCQLDDAWVAGAVDSSEVSVVSGHVGIVKERMVEDVEKLSADLEVDVFVGLERVEVL